MKKIKKIRIIESSLNDNRLTRSQMAALDGGDVCIIYDACLNNENGTCTSFYDKRLCADDMLPEQMYCDKHSM